MRGFKLKAVRLIRDRGVSADDWVGYRRPQDLDGDEVVRELDGLEAYRNEYVRHRRRHALPDTGTSVECF